MSGIITLDDEDEDFIDRMVLYFYTLDYLHETDWFDETSLALHAYMYFMGDKYQVAALKDLAKSHTGERFRSIASNSEMHGVLIGAQVAWNTTPDSDKGLRTLYIMAFLVNDEWNIFQDETLLLRLQGLQGFAWEALLVQRRLLAIGVAEKRDGPPEVGKWVLCNCTDNGRCKVGEVVCPDCGDDNIGVSLGYNDSREVHGRNVEAVVFESRPLIETVFNATRLNLKQGCFLQKVAVILPCTITSFHMKAMKLT